MNLPGAYRKLVAFPGNLTWKCVNMGALEIFDYSTASTGSNPKGDEVKRPRLSEDDTICIDVTEPTELRRSPDNFCKHNIELSFSLVPSCYATSCIRELMKN